MSDEEKFSYFAVAFKPADDLDVSIEFQWAENEGLALRQCEYAHPGCKILAWACVHEVEERVFSRREEW